MKSTVQLHIRSYASGWQSVRVLSSPEIATSGRHLPTMRNEVSEVLARELALQRMSDPGQTSTELETFTLDLTINAVEGHRLVPVPLTFLVATQNIRDDLWRVRVPSLLLDFSLAGKKHIEPWTTERIRGALHLKPVAGIVELAHMRKEWLEPLEVTWHGPGRYKRELRAIKAVAAARSAFEVPSGPLAQVGIELVAEAAANRIPRALDRSEEVARLLQAMARPTGGSAVVTGVSGVGKTAIIQELAHRLHAGNVPARLKGRPLWFVDGARLLAGSMYLGQWQQKALDVAEEARQQAAILYVGGLLEFVRAGSGRAGLNVGQLFLPFLERQDLLLLAEATPEAYNAVGRTHASFLRATQRVHLDAMDPERAFGVLDALGARIGKPHRTKVTPESLHAALALLARFGRHDALPGSGVALLDHMVRSWPGKTLERSHALDAFCSATGFPLRVVDDTVFLDESEIIDTFTERIIGQPEAIRRMTDLLLVVKAGLSDPDKPLGSFLFMGPTGVGKTESAKALASWLFGSNDRMIRFDMSEFGAWGSARRLVDGPNGQGLLTTKIREQPFCVLLLDEIEKAEPGLFDVLLQVLGEGRLTDGTGATVSFRHVIILMTSNLGAGARKRVGLVGESADGASRRFRKAAEDFFRPELVNRIDAIVPFRSLDEHDVRVIARIMLAQALDREGLTRRSIQVEWGEPVIEHLARVGFDPRYGARPMKRAIDDEVMSAVARVLVKHTEGGVLTLEVRDDAVHAHLDVR